MLHEIVPPLYSISCFCWQDFLCLPMPESMYSATLRTWDLFFAWCHPIGTGRELEEKGKHYEFPQSRSELGKLMAANQLCAGCEGHLSLFIYSLLFFLQSFIYHLFRTQVRSLVLT